MKTRIRISVIKFETINGKKVGKSFSFPIDAREMAKYKTEATVKKKVKEYVAKSGHFKREELDDLKYDMATFLEEWKKQKTIVEAEVIKALTASPNNAESRITPEQISRLGQNEIFVFGSNAQGNHRGGAARVAVNSFGAIMGQGHGLQGKSYAINTMTGIHDMIEDIEHFVHFVKKNPQMHFLVTPIGCGIAGYRVSEIAPLFKECKELKNVSLPKTFWDVIGFPNE